MKNIIKKIKGFTLIELLAIIVILTIIAVITIPIMLNVIDNARKGTAKDSAYGFKDSISKYYLSEMYNNNNIVLNGEYSVDDKGVLSNELETHEIMFSGTTPKGGTLIYANNVLVGGCLTIDDYRVDFEKGEIVTIEHGSCDDEEVLPEEPDEPVITYKCKRATALHTEQCTQDMNNCYAAGYYAEGSKGTTTITYGNLGSGDVINSGDAFDCDVNGNGEYEETERFYYVSDLYDTKTNEFNEEYAVLIYYSNTTNGVGDNTSSSLKPYYETAKENWYGPVSAISNLPTTSQWSNVSLLNTNRAILNEIGEGTTNDVSTVLPNSFSYEGYAARLLTTQEIARGCNITVGYYSSGELDGCTYLLENTKYSNSSSEILGYWLENPHKYLNYSVWNVNANRFVNDANANTTDKLSVRPVIEVLKSQIEL